jgi:CelD/BcsL family acetyltransferase involved in cellulose biosynthesis
MTGRRNGPLAATVKGELGEFRDTWDQLASEQPTPSVSMMSWWLEAGCRGDPVFLLVVEHGRLVGGLALEQEKWRGVWLTRLMASRLSPVNMDLIAEPGREKQVGDSVARWITQSGARICDFGGLASSSRIMEAIDVPTDSRVMRSTWCVSLDGGFEDFLQSRSRKLRKEIRRVREEAVATGRVTKRSGDGDIERALTTLRDLHTAQVGDESRFMPIMDEFSQAARSAVRTGNLFVHEVVAPSGNTEAIALGFRVGRRAELVIGGRDTSAPSGTGTLLLAYSIEQLSLDGVAEVDLGAGFDHYKERWASIQRDLYRVRFAVGLRSRLLVWLRDLMARTRAPEGQS